jgi:hypothetical protein
VPLVKAHGAKGKIFGSPGGGWFAATCNPKDPPYRLAEGDDIYWSRNAICRSGNAKILQKGRLGPADDQDRDIGSLPYPKDRIGTGPLWRLTEVENDDIGLAAADEVEEANLGGVTPARWRGVLCSPRYR